MNQQTTRAKPQTFAFCFEDENAPYGLIELMTGGAATLPTA